MKPKPLLKVISILGLIAVLGLLLASPAHAFDSRSGEDVIIEADEVIEDDLYVGASTFLLKGTVKGDLVVAGGTIEIAESGVVEGDLMAAGQSVVINGEVSDDARITGATLTLGGQGKVGDDIMGASYSLETQAGSSVNGDVAFAGGQALLAGAIGGDVHTALSSLALRGSVKGDVEAEVGGSDEAPGFYPFMFMPGAPSVPNIPAGLSIAPEATIGGNLKYTSFAKSNVPEGVVAGETTHLQPEVKPKEKAEQATPMNRFTGWLIDNLRTLISLLVVGLLMAWLVPNFTKNGADVLQAKPLHSLGWGLVSLFAAFFALLVLIAVVVILGIFLGIISLGGLVSTTVGVGGLAIGALILGITVAIAFVSKIVVSYLAGRLILKQIKPEWAEKIYWPALLGIVIFVILASIPYLGGIISFLVILFGLGALWMIGWERLRSRPSALPASD